jgi:hypothetical protein
MIGYGPGANHGDRFLAQALVVRAAQRFAINRYHLAGSHRKDRLHPREKALAKRLRIQSSKDAAKRVV